MKKAKVILIIVILLLALIVSLQNRKDVETKFLLATFTMPHVVLLVLTFVLGIVAGMIMASFILTKSDKPREKTKSGKKE